MELEEMDERQLLFESIKLDREESRFTAKEIREQAYKNIKKLVEEAES